MGNGRCPLHGGRTPAGAQWHRPQFPTTDAPFVIDKINRKAADLAKAERRRAKRLAAMSPAELERHQAWQKAHRPGDPKRRAAERERRRQDRDAAALIAASAAAPPSPATGEAALIAEELATLRAILAGHLKQTDDDNDLNLGVFG
jgi:hypothetical protein